MEGDAFVAIAGRKAAIRLVDELLPQTQCRRCGYDDCLAYAEAIVDGAPINRCPPGGAAGIDRLAGLTGRPATALDPETGSEGPLRLAKIDEGWCIGCTLCLAACPVDCIVGAPKRMHAVVAAQCTGCELCLPVCPVDCISMVDAPAAPSPISAGRSARTDVRAAEAKERYRFHGQRLGGAAAAEAEEAASGLPPADTGPGTAAAVAAVSPDIDLQALVEAALARTRRPPA